MCPFHSVFELHLGYMLLKEPSALLCCAYHLQVLLRTYPLIVQYNEYMIICSSPISVD